MDREIIPEWSIIMSIDGFTFGTMVPGVLIRLLSLMLTIDQKQHYDHQGFLVLKNVIGNQHLSALRAAALEIVDDFDIDNHRTVFKTEDRDAGRDSYFFDSAESIHCFLEEGALNENGELIKPARLAINKIGHAMHDLNPVFKKFCQLPVFGQILREIVCQNPLLWQTMYIFKQPHIGGKVRWHQDASYLITSPSSVAGIWVAIEDAHKDNGCLWVQPGGHRSPLREIYQVDHASGEGTLETLDKTPWPDFEQGRAVEVPAGSIVIFDSHMPHYSSQNLSPESRHAFTLHVADKSSRWSKKNWLQRPSLGEFKL